MELDSDGDAAACPRSRERGDAEASIFLSDHDDLAEFLAGCEHGDALVSASTQRRRSRSASVSPFAGSVRSRVPQPLPATGRFRLTDTVATTG
jgi:hypothetical protein